MTTEAVPIKVFAGNLSFKTKDSELAAAFSTAGKVVSANIIYRGSRSLGYGFVEFETQDEANNAITLMHKKNLDGRDINVEIAKPREELSKAPRPPPVAGEEGTSIRGGRGGFGRGRGSFRRRYPPRYPRPAGETHPVGGAPAGNASSPTGPGPVTGIATSPAPGSAPRRSGFRPPRRPVTPATYADRTLSKTTLFITNLPYSVEDKELGELFADYHVKSAYIARRRSNNRSKGFGFLELETEEEQQRALKEKDKMSVHGRELVLRVAYNEVTPRPAPTGVTVPTAA